MIPTAKLNELIKLETERTKVCGCCGKIKPLVNFTVTPNTRKLAGSYCVDCRRSKWYESKYKITLEEYELMLKQQNRRCAICGTTKAGKKNIYFSIDHDHKTGKIRGLLCYKCNTAIGMLHDDPELLEAATKYLRIHEPASE